METNKLIKFLLEEDSKELTVSEAIKIYFNKLKIHNRPGTVNYYAATLKPIIKKMQLLNIEHTSQINNNFIDKYVKSRIG